MDRHTSMNFTPSSNKFTMELDGYIIIENSVRMYYQFHGTMDATKNFMKLFNVDKVN